MAVVSNKIPEFAGFAVRYDPNAKPFFQSTVLEDLRRIASKPIGAKLLADIAAAQPRARAAAAISSDEVKAVVFDVGVNVVMVPTSMEYTQSGMKMASTGVGVEKSLKPSTAASHNVPGCPYHPAGGSCAVAADIIAAGNGTGTVSVMRYTNAQILTGKGEATHSFIVLAHELIHSFHHLSGTRRDHGEEEWTTGLGAFVDEPLSENAFRKAFGMKLREKY